MIIIISENKFREGGQAMFLAAVIAQNKLNKGEAIRSPFVKLILRELDFKYKRLSPKKSAADLQPWQININLPPKVAVGIFVSNVLIERLI